MEFLYGTRIQGLGSMKRRSSILGFVSLSALTALAVFAGGQAGDTQQASQPSEQICCPVTTDEQIDPEVFTDYKGLRVYFCCGGNSQNA